MQSVASSRAGIAATLLKLSLVIALVLLPFGMSHGVTKADGQSDISWIHAAASAHHGETHDAGETETTPFQQASSSSQHGEHSSHSGEECCAFACGGAVLSDLSNDGSTSRYELFNALLTAAILPGELADPSRPPRT